MHRFFARHKALWISVVSVIAGVFMLWMTKALILSFALSMKMGINISVSDWSISWRSMSFKNFQIRTPSDPVYKTGLSIGSIDIKAGLFDLVRKTSRIDSVIINDVFMGVNIRSDGSSNWSKPLKKLSQSSGSSSSKGSDVRFVIGEFDLNRVTVGLTTPGKKEKRYGPTSIHASNLGSRRPMSIGGLVEFIASEITGEIIKKYALPNLLQGIVKNSGKALFTPFRLMKKLFSQAEEAQELHDFESY